MIPWTINNGGSWVIGAGFNLLRQELRRIAREDGVLCPRHFDQARAVGDRLGAYVTTEILVTMLNEPRWHVAPDGHPLTDEEAWGRIANAENEVGKLCCYVGDDVFNDLLRKVAEGRTK